MSRQINPNSKRISNVKIVIRYTDDSERTYSLPFSPGMGDKFQITSVSGSSRSPDTSFVFEHHGTYSLYETDAPLRDKTETPE